MGWNNNRQLIESFKIVEPINIMDAVHHDDSDAEFEKKMLIKKYVVLSMSNDNLYMGDDFKS